MIIRSPRTHALFLLVLVLAFSACATHPTTEAVSKFSVALDGTTSSVQQGLQEVQRMEVAAQDAKTALDFVSNAKSPLHLGKNGSITQAVIEPRIRFFKELNSYSDSLAKLVSKEEEEKVKAKFMATGKSFADFASTVAPKFGTQLPEGLAETVKASFEEMGKFLQGELLSRELPPIITAMHGNLVSAVTAFKEDLGSKEAGGFKQILDDSIKRLIDGKKKLLILMRGEGKVTKADLYKEVLAAQDEIRELRRAERLLNAIPGALDKLVEAHEALQAPKDPRTRAKVEIFLERSRGLKEIAQSLMK